jgi:hypothetical protein
MLPVGGELTTFRGIDGTEIQGFVLDLDWSELDLPVFDLSELDLPTFGLSEFDLANIENIQTSPRRYPRFRKHKRRLCKNIAAAIAYYEV